MIPWSAVLECIDGCLGYTDIWNLFTWDVRGEREERSPAPLPRQFATGYRLCERMKVLARNGVAVIICKIMRKKNKWWKKKIFHIIARAMVNCLVIYNQSRTQRRKLRFSHFLMTCGESLVQSAAPDAAAGSSHGPHFAGIVTRLVGRHFMERIPATEKKTFVSKVCKVCADTIKKQTGTKRNYLLLPKLQRPLMLLPLLQKISYPERLYHIKTT